MSCCNEWETAHSEHREDGRLRWLSARFCGA